MRLRDRLRSWSKAERHRRKVDVMPPEVECMACGTVTTDVVRLVPCEQCKAWYCRIDCFTFHGEASRASA